MTFHKQTFQRRFATMGDTSEAVFDLVYPKHHRLGLNRPPFFMGGMPLAMRYTPDRMLRDRLVECMGVGRDRLLKIKHEKIEALQAWACIGPVMLFVYDQTDHVYYEDTLDEWVRQTEAHGIGRTFENDGKTYIELHVDHFPSNPLPIPEEDDAA